MGNGCTTTPAPPKSKQRTTVKSEKVKQSTDIAAAKQADVETDTATSPLNPVVNRQQKYTTKENPISTRDRNDKGNTSPETAAPGKTRHQPEERKTTPANEVNPGHSRDIKIDDTQPDDEDISPRESLYPYHPGVTYRRRDNIYKNKIPYYDDSECDMPGQLHPNNSKWFQYDIAREPVIGGPGQGYKMLRRDWNKGSLKYVSVNSIRDPAIGRWELDRSICARLRDDKYCPYITDITVIETVWGSAIVVGDHLNKSVKCFFYKADQYRHSCFHLTEFPKGVTRSTLGGVAVAVPEAKKILFLCVTPELKYNYHVLTQKKYHYLAGITETKFAASAPWEHLPAVDVVDSSGYLIYSVCDGGSLFSRPTYLTLTPKKELIVVDKCYAMAEGKMTSCMKLVCVSLSGKIKWTYPFEDTGYAGLHHVIKYPAGVSCDLDGGVFVADIRLHKIVQLTSEGRCVSEIITQDDDLSSPDGVYYDYHKHRLFIGERRGQIKVFNLPWQNVDMSTEFKR